MPILIVINLKGGVAKTTNAVAIAECFASQGLRTLMIDADHQCMTGELLLGESRLLRCERSKSTLHDLLAAMLDEEFHPEQIGEYVTNSASNIAGGMKRLSVIPCSVRIDDFSTNMAKARRGYQSTDEFLQVFARRRQQLRRWLAANFDFVIIDCPPSLALQVRAFLQWLKDSLSLRCRTASPFVAHYTCWSDSPNQGTARLSRSARSGRYFDIKTVSTEGLWTS